MVENVSILNETRVVMDNEVTIVSFNYHFLQNIQLIDSNTAVILLYTEKVNVSVMANEMNCGILRVCKKRFEPNH